MYTTKKGMPLLGCNLESNGANFGIFAKTVQCMVLEIYHSYEETIPVLKVTLDRNNHTTGDIFHIYIEDIKEGMGYIWRTVDKNDVYSQNIIDPYTLSIKENLEHHENSKNIVVGKHYYQNRKPKITWAQTIIYELHVGSFTKHVSSGLEASKRGTFDGVIEKIGYLKDLGITTIELLPVFKWNKNTLKNYHPVTGERLQDVWGYNPIAFFALDEKYSVEKDGYKVMQEFRHFVDEAHNNGIEVILDVVYNHTGEGGASGEAFNFKYLAKEIYYKFNDSNEYLNDSGTGNTLNTNHYVVKQMILDSLRYWVIYMGVDGFRFDLASILGQDKSGKWLSHSVLNDISEDPILSNVKLIAESWDAKGSYDVGRMPFHFREWSDYFRDTARKFVRGDQGLTKSMADCMLGKEIYFTDPQKDNTHTIHFITAHDGFTMWDLLSYESKHNYENGEGNRDGHNANYSCNCGIEGETPHADVINMRKRRVKNFMCLLLLSKGVPMLLMGDELCRTQKGNNNAYCQDNETVWLDWSRLTLCQDTHSFIKNLIEIRKGLKYFNTSEMDKYQVTWHGVHPNKPDWSYFSRSFACQIQGENENIYIIANSYYEALTFELPAAQSVWQRIIDTNLTSPKDAKIIGDDIHNNRYTVECFSICVFIEK